jgi:hypothetical protein
MTVEAPARAPAQGTGGRIAAVRGRIGQQLVERCAVRFLVQPPEDAVAGLGHGVQHHCGQK